jgi:hypothetical protein
MGADLNDYMKCSNDNRTLTVIKINDRQPGTRVALAAQSVAESRTIFVLNLIKIIIIINTIIIII